MYIGNKIQLIGYIDSNWGDSDREIRSTTRSCSRLGSSMFSWISRKQDTIALSSAEVEYVVASEVYQEVVWLRKLQSKLFEGPLSPTWIHSDNQSCIRLMIDLMFHAKMKHINNKYHYIRS